MKSWKKILIISPEYNENKTFQESAHLKYTYLQHILVKHVNLNIVVSFGLFDLLCAWVFINKKKKIELNRNFQAMKLNRQLLTNLMSAENLVVYFIWQMFVNYKVDRFPTGIGIMNETYMLEYNLKNKKCYLVWGGVLWILHCVSMSLPFDNDLPRRITRNCLLF